MREKPKRFNISLPPELADHLRETKTVRFPQFSQRKVIEILIRKGLEETEREEKADSGKES